METIGPKLQKIFNEVNATMKYMEDKKILESHPVAITDFTTWEISASIEGATPKEQFIAMKGVIRTRVNYLKTFDIIALGIFARNPIMQKALEEVYKEKIDNKCLFDIKEDVRKYAETNIL